MIAQISYKRLFHDAVPSQTSSRIAALSPLFLLAANILFRKNQQRREKERV